MDGKQARKTGNSSPLGLIFDHGCDSVVVVFCTMMVARMLNIGDNFFLLIALTSTSAPFYFATLEEYYVGGLFLPPGNGASDGMPVYIFVCFLSAVMGSESWGVILGGSFRLSHLICIFIFIGTFISVLVNIKKMTDPDREYHPNGLDKCQLVQDVAAYFVLTLLVYFSVIIHGGDPMKDSPKAVMYMYGFSYVTLTIYI